MAIVISELALALRRPYLLLAPTNSYLDAHCQQRLANAGAGFFPLETTIELLASGRSQAKQSPGEIFSRFTPQPREVAERAFALVKKLGGTGKPPTAMTVFSLYCIEGLSIPQIARQCGCSLGTVANRLQLIRASTGSEPMAFRRISGHLSRLEEEAGDSRARRIYQRGALEGD